jgi:hypothetical protein
LGITRAQRHIGEQASRTVASSSELELLPPLDDTGYDDLNAGHPEPSPDTSEAGQTEPSPSMSATRQPEECKAIVPEDLVCLPNEDDPGEIICLPKLETTQLFVDALGTASLENSGMLAQDIESLQDPGPAWDVEDPLPLLRSLRHFINNASSSRAHYEGICNIELLNNPANDFLSFDQVKQRLGWLSRVVPIQHNMCPDSCVAYTGPYTNLDACPSCSTPCFLPDTQTPQKCFTTVLIGPVIQAFYGSCDVADMMHYLERRLATNSEQIRLNSGYLDKYNDTLCGKELIDAWNKGTFQKSDITLQLSIDSAQLRPNQPSEAWVFIWIFHNLPPQFRYKKRFVIPGSIVPGLKKPKEIDLFLFPLISHMAALQCEGLRVYDVYLDAYIPCAILMIIFATADSLGSASMSGMVGHSGRFGCHLYCDMPSHHHKGDGHYYPALQCPHNYNLAGCSHPDIHNHDLQKYRSNLSQKYQQNIQHLLAARTQNDYQLRHLIVGLCKQTLFSSLPHCPLPVLNIFTMDIMHLTVLNDLDLFTKLFLGKLDVYKPDNRSSWDWVIFYQNGALWDAHGKTVERAVLYLLSCFRRAPRNPAKKLNSGYKAWEFQQYLYGLGPTLF